MVKLNRPNLPIDERPDAYKNNETKTADEEIDLGEPHYQDVPKYKYGSVNLKKYESFKLARSSIKLNNQEALAITELNQWLSNIDVQLNSMNIQLLIDVVNFLHQYFIYGCESDRQDSINRVMYQCMTKYFKNDRDVIDVLLKSSKKLIKKSTMLSRRIAKTRNFFFMAVEWIVSSRSSNR